VTLRQAFARRVDALDAIVAFTDRAVDPAALAPAKRQVLHFAIEELFTNMVKYSPAGAAHIVLELTCNEGDIEVTLIDSGVERFDPTAAPDAQTALAIEDRQPGGLGLHLVRRMVEALHYEYVAERHESRTAFRVRAC